MPKNLNTSLNYVEVRDMTMRTINTVVTNIVSRIAIPRSICKFYSDPIVEITNEIFSLYSIVDSELIANRIANYHDTTPAIKCDIRTYVNALINGYSKLPYAKLVMDNEISTNMLKLKFLGKYQFVLNGEIK